MKIVPIQKVITYLFYLLFFITPLYMSAGTSELFEFNKMLVIYLITGVIISLWIGQMLISRKIIFQRTVLTVPLFLFLSSNIVSTFISIDRRTSIFGYYGRFNGGLLSIVSFVVLYFAFVTYMSHSSRAVIRERIENLMKVSLSASVFVMLWGLPSHFGYDLTCLLFTGKLDVACWTEQFRPTIRMFSTLGQPNWLAAYMVVHAFFGLYFLVKSKTLSYKSMYVIYLVSAWITILFTRSRSAYVALIISCVSMGSYFVYSYFKSGRAYSRQNTYLYGILSVVLGISLMSIGTGSAGIDRFIHIPTLLQEKNTDTLEKTSQKKVVTESGSIRKIVWQGAFGLGLEYPFFGTGVETFAYSYQFVRSLEHNLTTEWDFIYNKAHNEYFNYLATTGFVGLLTYILVSAFVLLQWKHVFHKDTNANDAFLLAILLSAYMSCMVTNFFGFSTSTIQLNYYILPAGIMLLTSREQFRKREEAFTIQEKDSLRILIPLFIALATVWFVIGYSRADRAYAKGDMLMTAGSYDEALPYLYQAFNLRKEHVYADKIAQLLAQESYKEFQSKGSYTCTSHTGQSLPCTELSNFYMNIALSMSPQNAAYYRSLARNNFTFYQASSDDVYFKQALKHIDTARSIAPTDPKLPYFRALFALGNYELKSKPTQKDRTDLERIGLPSIEFALLLKPNYADAYYVKGLLLKALKRNEEARETFTYLLDHIDPNYEQARQEIEGLN